MVLAIDVHYREDIAKAVGILFNWTDNEPKQILIEYLQGIEEYVPGQFYKRELPCILKIINKIDLSLIEVIIIDGQVFIDNNKSYGLGGHLWETLNKEKPIIGVAKKFYHNTEKVVHPVYRGSSKIPLYVSSVGIDSLKAETLVKNMHGEYRIPTVLKQLDIQTKLP